MKVEAVTTYPPAHKPPAVSGPLTPVDPLRAPAQAAPHPTPPPPEPSRLHSVLGYGATAKTLADNGPLYVDLLG